LSAIPATFTRKLPAREFEIDSQKVLVSTTIGDRADTGTCVIFIIQQDILLGNIVRGTRSISTDITCID
jgi:hypothetical protein